MWSWPCRWSGTLSIVTALICLINTHLLWLYKIGKSSKRCVLSAGDAVILSVFYPYLLKTCHSILPHILIFISLMLLGLTALKKSRLTSNSNSDCSTRQGRRTTGCLSTRFIESTGNTKEQNVFTEPTQLAIYLGIVNFLFEIAEVIEWLHMKFIIPNYFQPFTINFNLNPYINNNTNVNITNTDSILLSNSLYSSKLLSKSINQMCTIQFTSGLLRIWSSQRYLFTFPILFYKSSKFKHITKYFFKYYFQALKMQYLFKISFTAQNSTFIDSLNTSMHINASNNENTNNQISERINITEYINTHSHQGNTRIKTKRIPRVYCCSCSTHPLTLDGTIDNGKHSDAHEYH
ncbi:unnamed protein product [Heterobilharzia americana]|nr:unnamed protein product [Heterobilharzia americana]